MTTYAELKELESKLAELKKLPEIEAEAERENRNRQNEQRLASYEHSLGELAGRFKAAESAITSHKAELIAAIDRLLNLIQEEQRLFQQGDKLAAAAGAARVALGRGQWHDYTPGDERREAARIMAEFAIRPPDGLGPILESLRTSLTPPPARPVDSRLPIVNHDGETVLG